MPSRAKPIPAGATGGEAARSTAGGGKVATNWAIRASKAARSTARIARRKVAALGTRPGGKPTAGPSSSACSATHCAMARRLGWPLTSAAAISVSSTGHG